MLEKHHLLPHAFYISGMLARKSNFKKYHKLRKGYYTLETLYTMHEHSSMDLYEHIIKALGEIVKNAKIVCMVCVCALFCGYSVHCTLCSPREKKLQGEEKNVKTLRSTYNA